MWPENSRVKLEESDERLKVTMPVKRNGGLVILFTFLVLIWVGMLVFVLVRSWRIPDYEYPSLIIIVLLAVMLIWILVWLRFGRFLWRQWQYVLATREILFVNQEMIIVRRPVSILGVTDAYAMSHVQPFHFDEARSALTFSFGARPIHFGHDLTPDEARALALVLNNHFFPDYDDEDE